MDKTTHYTTIVEWSEEDHCFVGSCPELFHGGCHGDDKAQVLAGLCDLVEDTFKLYRQEGRPLP